MNASPANSHNCQLDSDMESANNICSCGCELKYPSLPGRTAGYRSARSGRIEMESAYFSSCFFMTRIVAVTQQAMSIKKRMNAANSAIMISELIHIRSRSTRRSEFSVPSSAMASDGFGLAPASHCSRNGARVRPKRLSSFLDSSNCFLEAHCSI